MDPKYFRGTCICGWKGEKFYFETEDGKEIASKRVKVSLDEHIKGCDKFKKAYLKSQEKTEKRNYEDRMVSLAYSLQNDVDKMGLKNVKKLIRMLETGKTASQYQREILDRR